MIVSCLGTQANDEVDLLKYFSQFVSWKGPYTEYRIIVIAFTLKYDGEPSDPVIQRTDIAGPSAPQIINLTCHSQDALYLQWKRPTTFYNSIDFYVINYKESSYANYQQIQLNTTATFSETAVGRNTKTFISDFDLKFRRKYTHESLFEVIFVLVKFVRSFRHQKLLIQNSTPENFSVKVNKNVKLIKDYCYPVTALIPL